MHCLDFFDDIVWLAPTLNSSAGATVAAPGCFGRIARVRRAAAPPTPGDLRIGRALLHRRLIQDAADRALRGILVLEGEFLVLDDAEDYLCASLAALARRPWMALHLGCRDGADTLKPVDGCASLVLCPEPAATGGYAIHNDAFPRLLADMPSEFQAMRDWAEARSDVYSALRSLPLSYAVSPGITCLPADLPHQPVELQHRFGT